MTIKAELFLDRKAFLGEGVVWDPRDGTLHWLDVLASRIFSCDASGENIAEIDAGRHVGCIAPRASGGWIMAARDGFSFIDLSTGKVTPISNPEAGIEGNRFNDGKCDPRGRLWAGTMSYEMKPRAGSLYRLDPGGQAHRMLPGVTVSNGLAWTRDGRTMYFNDSPLKKVQAFDFDPERGTIANGRDAVLVPKERGYPDGMCIDENDNLWVALWGASCVACWNPRSGELLETIDVAASHVSCCCFGGANLDTLYITTAREHLKSDQLRAQPLAGGLFRAHPGVRGLPSFEFSG